MGYMRKEIGSEGKECFKDTNKDGSKDNVDLSIEDHKLLVDTSMNAYSDLYRPRTDIRGPQEIFSF